jgi:hypothetical protein
MYFVFSIHEIIKYRMNCTFHSHVNMNNYISNIAAGSNENKSCT